MMPTDPAPPLWLAGASGSIGAAVLREALLRGQAVVCLLRRPPEQALPPRAEARVGPLHDAQWLREVGLRGAAGAALISCVASRNGRPADAWAVDHDLQQALLQGFQQAGGAHFVLLSAICVQKPELAFQHAKLAFEACLRASGLRHSIVRPTAYFKSLSGQVARVAAGKPVWLVGDGRRTACKPIGDADLARYLLDCVHEPARWNQVLPIGGPGPAQTPREQAEALFAQAGRPPRFRSLPPGVMDALVALLAAAGRLWPRAAAAAEFARIGRYYGRESMLVWDGQRYRAELTPETGAERLIEHQARLLAGALRHELGEQALF